MKTRIPLLFLLALLPWFGHAQNYTFSRMASCPQSLYATGNFTIGDTMYVVDGVIANAQTEPKNLTINVWAYNTVSNTWIQKNNFPGQAIYSPSAFAINGYGYIVTGWDSLGQGNGPVTLYQYDPAADTWTTKAPFPGSPRYAAATFVLNNKAYMCCGFKPYNNELWEYDPATDTWTQKTSLPGITREGPCAFTIGNYEYLGMGYSYDSYNGGWFLESDWYKYDPTADTWTQLNYFPYEPLAGAYSFVLNNEGYLVNGSDQSNLSYTGQQSNKVWKYSPSSDTWMLWGIFPDTAIQGGPSITVGTAAFLGLGVTNTFYYPIIPYFWRFGPGTAPYSCAATINALYMNAGTRDFQANGNFSPSALVSWNFGDSTTGSGTSVIHDFGASGTYVVTLTVTDSLGGGCSSSVSDTLVITNVSTCSVVAGNSNIGSNYTLFATITGSGPYTYNWTSTNNNSFDQTSPDPWVGLNPNDTTTFCVFITDSTGCTASSCETIISTPDTVTTGGCQTYIYVGPDPNFPGVYDACAYHTGASPESYLWTFGDGTSSTDSFPSHTYTMAGYYSICLTITDSNNCVSSFCDSIFYAFKEAGGPMNQLNTRKGTPAPTFTSIPKVETHIGVSVYPNPANDELNIVIGGNKLDRVVIYNTQGQKVSDLVAPAINKINIIKLAPGIYYLDVKSGESSGKVKFVKTN